jgi:hypothetical protein
MNDVSRLELDISFRYFRIIWSNLCHSPYMFGGFTSRLEWNQEICC